MVGEETDVLFVSPTIEHCPNQHNLPNTNPNKLDFPGDLAPASGYTIKLTICYDTMESMASPLSPLFVTKPVTVPSDIPREGVHVLMDANSGGSPTNINDSSGYSDPNPNGPLTNHTLTIH